jgi:hypothetical protein
MHIDEAGTEHQASGIEFVGAISFDVAADGNDPRAVAKNIGLVGRAVRRDNAVLDEEAAGHVYSSSLTPKGGARTVAEKRRPR